MEMQLSSTSIVSVALPIPTLDEEFGMLIQKLEQVGVTNRQRDHGDTLIERLAARFRGVKLNGEVDRTVALMKHMFKCLGYHIPECPTCLDKGGVAVEGCGHWVVCPDCKGDYEDGQDRTN